MKIIITGFFGNCEALSSIHFIKDLKTNSIQNWGIQTFIRRHSLTPQKKEKELKHNTIGNPFKRSQIYSFTLMLRIMCNGRLRPEKGSDFFEESTHLSLFGGITLLCSTDDELNHQRAPIFRTLYAHQKIHGIAGIPLLGYSTSISTSPSFDGGPLKILYSKCKLIIWIFYWLHHIIVLIQYHRLREKELRFKSRTLIYI